MAGHILFLVHRLNTALEQQACRGLTPGQADAVKLCMEQMLRNLGGPAEDRSSRDGRKIQC